MTSNLKPACVTGDERVLNLVRRLAREKGVEMDRDFALAAFCKVVVRACYGGDRDFATRLGQKWMALQLLREGEEAAELEQIRDLQSPRAKELLDSVTGSERNRIGSLEKLGRTLGVFRVCNGQKGNRRRLEPTPVLLKAMERPHLEPARGPAGARDRCTPRRATVARLDVQPEGPNQETTYLPSGGATPPPGGENRMRKILEAAQEPVLASGEPAVDAEPTETQASSGGPQRRPQPATSSPGGGGGRLFEEPKPQPARSSGAWDELLGEVRKVLVAADLAGDRAPKDKRLTMDAAEARAAGQFNRRGKPTPDFAAVAPTLKKLMRDWRVSESGLAEFGRKVKKRLMDAGCELHGPKGAKIVGSWKKPVLHYLLRGFLPDADAKAAKKDKPDEAALLWANVALEELGGGELGDLSEVAREYVAFRDAWRRAHPNAPVGAFEAEEAALGEKWVQHARKRRDPVDALRWKMRNAVDELNTQAKHLEEGGR